MYQNAWVDSIKFRRSHSDCCWLSWIVGCCCLAGNFHSIYLKSHSFWCFALLHQSNLFFSCIRHKELLLFHFKIVNDTHVLYSFDSQSVQPVFAHSLCILFHNVFLSSIFSFILCFFFVIPSTVWLMLLRARIVAIYCKIEHRIFNVTPEVTTYDYTAVPQ